MPRTIVAMGGGGLSTDPTSPAMEEFILSLARRPRPAVCFLPTASADSDGYTLGFYRAFSKLDCRPTDLQLFRRTVDDLDAFVLAQDIIYVGGGNTASQLGVWHAHGLDDVLRRAWERGVVLCGTSAGAICWFEQSVTDSFSADRLAPLYDGLGLLRGSCCPHYDGEELRRPAYHRFVARGELTDGWAVDEGAALVFNGEEPAYVVSSRPGATAYRVERTADGVVERPLPARPLSPK